MLVKIYGDNPSEKAVGEVVEILERDKCIIFPTDSLYAVGCSIRSQRAIDRLQDKKSRELLTLIFADISQIAEYCRVDNAAFRILKRNLPGPFTFILPASSRVPHKAIGKRKSIGVRIPDNPVTLALVRALGAPLVSTSLKPLSDEPEYLTNPELMEEMFRSEVGCVVDGGLGGLEPSTVVEIDNSQVSVLREGAGVLQ